MIFIINKKGGSICRQKKLEKLRFERLSAISPSLREMAK